MFMQGFTTELGYLVVKEQNYFVGENYKLV
jgi:hypothetical protein